MTELQDDAVLLSEQTQTQSAEYIGRWNELISTTNWDKGRIICDWRDALIAAQAPPLEYSDEAWSKLVGNVTPQHVGRLRRVYQRFDNDRDSYTGLYWSHFCAALEWEDAEMWLEGAIQNEWSISQMRRQRWETLGARPGDEPREGEIIAVESSEENILSPHDFEEAADLPPELMFDGEPVEVEAASSSKPNEPAQGGLPKPRDDEEGSALIYSTDANPVGKFVHSFDDLTDLPADLTSAFEQYKQVILHHKEAGWEKVSQADVLSSLESLKALVTSA